MFVLMKTMDLAFGKVHETLIPDTCHLLRIGAIIEFAFITGCRYALCGTKIDKLYVPTLCDRVARRQ
jgi:hypothetical protein